MSDVTPTSNSTTAAQGGAMPPQGIPDHELIRRIGRGAYGEVWIARSVTGAFRAVKIVRRSSFDHERPFEREFEGILKFEPISRTHDSQVDILHVGRGEDYFYYVMELADDQVTGGQINPDHYNPRTLKSDLLFRSRLSFEECVSVGISLTTALEHLHNSGLVHRDVKPSNIIFVNGVAKLADIGLVTGVDTTRSYVGTEGFAAPEGPGTAQADIYSLGKVLYEMSTGKDRQEFPELPTNLRELPERDGLVELNAVIAKACRHDPRDRYPNAAAMRADLELLQGGKSLARLHRVEQRLRLMSRIGGGAMVFALLILAGWFYQRLQTREARRLASENQALAESKTQLADDKSKLAEENRRRLIDLDNANGVRLMNAGDLGSAMLWFADALKYATDDPAQAEMQRLRLSMLLQMHPKPLAVISIGNGTNNTDYGFAISRNGRRLLVNSPDTIELWELSTPPLRLVHAPIERARVVRLPLNSDGGRFIAFNSQRDEAQLWTVKSSNDVEAIVLQAKSLHDVEFAENDRVIVGLSSNRSVVVLDAQSGQFLREAAKLDVPAERLVFSGDRRAAAVMLTNHLVRILDLATGGVVREVAMGGNGDLACVSSDGRIVLSAPLRLSFARYPLASIEFEAKIWDLAAGSIVSHPLRHDDFIWRAEMSRNGKSVATGSADRTARVWNVFTGDPITPPLKHAAGVFGLAFSPDGARIATGDLDGNAQVWDVGMAKPVTPRLHHGSACSVAFARDGAILVTASVDGMIRLWDIASAETPAVTLEEQKEVRDLLFSPNGEYLLVNSEPTKVWRTRDWKLVCAVQPTTVDITRKVKFSPDSQCIAVIFRDPSIAQVWNVQTGKPAGPPLAFGTNRCLDISFSADGRTLATAGSDDVVRIWDWQQARQLHEFMQHSNRVLSVELSPKGDRMLTATAERRGAAYRLWNLETGRIIAEGTCSESYEVHPFFHADGSKWLFAPSARRLQIMAASDGRPLSPVIGHDLAITCARFSPDGKQVISGSLDKTAREWDAVSGRGLIPPLPHDAIISQCAFSLGNRLIMTRTQSGSVRLWDGIGGLPMTPSLPDRGPFAALHPDGGMLAIAASKRQVAVLNLQCDASPELAKDLIDWNTGGFITNATIQKLDRNQLRRIYDRNRARHPEQFALSEEQIARWHDAQVLEFGHLNQLEFSLFHSERLLELQPTNALFRERHGRLLAKRVPARDPATPPHLIDLTDYYTRSFETLVNGDLDKLPRGIQKLAGIEFDLRGLLVLDHPAPWRIGLPGEFPQVSHIRIAQRCQRLHFLQAIESANTDDGVEYSRYVVHYADGSQRTLPMVGGRHLGGWWGDQTPKPVTEAVIAWQFKSEGHSSRSLYKTTWNNPNPELEITHVDFQLGEAKMRPMLVAIIAE